MMTLYLNTTWWYPPHKTLLVVCESLNLKLYKNIVYQNSFGNVITWIFNIIDNENLRKRSTSTLADPNPNPTPFIVISSW